MVTRLVRGVCALLLSAAALSGCTQSGVGASAPGADGRHPYTIPHVLRYATAEDIVGLNPHLGQQLVVSYMSSLTMAWLLRFDHGNSPIPELAIVVPTLANGGISRDGLAITYHLRHNVKWSDGKPFDADDVVFSTHVVLDKRNNEVSTDGWDLITRIDEPDKYTVRFHLRKPYSAYASTYFGTAGANPCILPKHLFPSTAINTAPYNALPVGIGPFRYTQWKRADRVIMVANPYYWRGRPKLDRVEFHIVPDRNTVLTQLTSHEVDLWTPVSGPFYDQVKKIPGITVLKQMSLNFNHLTFQTQHGGLRDERVRHALRMAIDRHEIVAKIRHGLGTVQDNFLSPGSPLYDPNIPTDAFDLKAAGALLDSAGWMPGPDGLRHKGADKLDLAFATPVGTPDTDQMIELIRATWKRIGVGITVRHYPTPLLFAPFNAGGIIYTGKWDVVAFAWTGQASGDYSRIFGCDAFPPNGQNSGRWCDPAANAAMTAFKATYDPAEQKRVEATVQQRIAAGVPLAVLVIPDDIYAYNGDLKGLHPNQVTPFDDFMNVDI
jgi:peptide/nickel transport system substrate-binding protein